MSSNLPSMFRVTLASLGLRLVPGLKAIPTWMVPEGFLPLCRFGIAQGLSFCSGPKGHQVKKVYRHLMKYCGHIAHNSLGPMEALGGLKGVTVLETPVPSQKHFFSELEPRAWKSQD